MKRLFLYSILLLGIFSSCITEEERNASEVMVRSLISSLQNNDTAAFHALFMTEQEMLKMAMSGQKEREKEDRRLSPLDIHMVYITRESKISECFSELKKLGEKNGINWKNAQLTSIDDVDQRTEVGVEIWEVEATVQTGEKKFKFKLCDSFLQDGKLKMVQVRKYE